MENILDTLLKVAEAIKDTDEGYEAIREFIAKHKLPPSKDPKNPIRIIDAVVEHLDIFAYAPAELNSNILVEGLKLRHGDIHVDVMFEQALTDNSVRVAKFAVNAKNTTTGASINFSVTNDADTDKFPSTVYSFAYALMSIPSIIFDSTGKTHGGSLRDAVVIQPAIKFIEAVLEPQMAASITNVLAMDNHIKHFNKETGKVKTLPEAGEEFFKEVKATNKVEQNTPAPVSEQELQNNVVTNVEPITDPVKLDNLKSKHPLADSRLTDPVSALADIKLAVASHPLVDVVIAASTEDDIEHMLIEGELKDLEQGNVTWPLYILEKYRSNLSEQALSYTSESAKSFAISQIAKILTVNCDKRLLTEQEPYEALVNVSNWVTAYNFGTLIYRLFKYHITKLLDLENIEVEDSIVSYNLADNGKLPESRAFFEQVNPIENLPVGVCVTEHDDYLINWLKAPIKGHEVSDHAVVCVGFTNDAVYLRTCLLNSKRKVIDTCQQFDYLRHTDIVTALALIVKICDNIRNMKELNTDEE